MSRILLVTTSSSHMPGDNGLSGLWLDEATTPYYIFADARCDITVASPLGGNIPIDPTSQQPEYLTASTHRYAADASAQAAFANSKKLGELTLTDYDALYFPGGHGTMQDLPTAPAVRAAVEYFYAAGKPLASVCHGPACLINARKPNGEPLIKNHRFTCFTNQEENYIGMADRMLFLLQTKLTELGGIADIAEPFKGQVVVSDHLITGQNPASSLAAAEAVLAQLRTK